MAVRTVGGLERGEIVVAGVRRTYWLARAPRRREEPPPPLLIVLHGSGTDGRAMAWYTGLAQRAPAAGLTTVFPDGWKGAWHPARPPAGVSDLDDALFLRELALHLEGLGAASSWPVVLAGISQGARYAEHVARHGLLPVTGLFLVAGTGLEFSRRLAPVPLLRTSMVLVIGTADATTPYSGGPLTRHGLTGWQLKRRAVRHGELPGEDVVVGAGQLVRDWATGNGIIDGTTTRGTVAVTVTGGFSFTLPVTEELPMSSPRDLPVTKETWTRPGCRTATLYRIEGGGHGWPGGPQFMPRSVIGPIGRHLDATALLLELAARETVVAAGRPALNPGQQTR
jgi:polyhydroxybutyrate depolymerase